MGFTTADLKFMSLGRLILMADEYTSVNKSEKSNEPRKATQADIDALLG